MALHYGISQPLRFYKELEHQNRYRKGGSINAFNLYCPLGRALPFQLLLGANEAPISSMNYVNAETGEEYPLISRVQFGQLKTYTVGDKQHFVHFGSAALNGDSVPEGRYYIKLGNGAREWFSEVITLRDFDYDLEGQECVLTRIEYWSTCDIADIFYRTVEAGDEQYVNVIFLDVETGRPEYLYNEEGDEDGEGRFAAEFKQSQKQYLLQGLFPEFLTDALALLPLHINRNSEKGQVKVFTHLGESSEIDRVAMQTEWVGTDAAWAVTDITFVAETVLKTNCCGDEGEITSTDVEVNCLTAATPVVSAILEGSSNYANGEYTDEATGEQVPLMDGDLVIIIESIFDFFLRTYVAADGSYADVTPQPALGLSYYDSSKIQGAANPYYKNSDGARVSRRPLVIADEPNGVNPAANERIITGEVWNTCTVEVVTYGPNGDEVVGSSTGADFNAQGIVYTHAANAFGVRLETEGDNGCYLGASANQPYENVASRGINISIIDDDFVVG